MARNHQQGAGSCEDVTACQLDAYIACYFARQQRPPCQPQNNETWLHVPISNHPVLQNACQATAPLAAGLTRSQSTIADLGGAQSATTGSSSLRRNESPWLGRRAISQMPMAYSTIGDAHNRADVEMAFDPMGSHAGRIPRSYSNSSAPSPAQPAYHQPVHAQQRSDSGPDIGMDPEAYLQSLQLGYSSFETSQSELQPNEAYATRMPDCSWLSDGLELDLLDQGSCNTSTLDATSMFDASSAASMVRDMSSRSQYTDASFCSQEFSSAGKHSSPDASILRDLALGPQLLASLPMEPMTSQNSDVLWSAHEQQVSMQRCDSSNSTSSSRSASSQRYTKRNAEILENAKTALAARPVRKDDAATPKVTRERASGKARSNKNHHPRRPPRRTFCDLCTDHLEGFRGDHELRRHKMSKHNNFPRQFVCTQPPPGKADIEPKVPLSQCRHCTRGKRYGADYNAAAHLRRTHFKPKPSRGEKGKPHEKRGGKGGGDWPPMSVLRMYFHEVSLSRESSKTLPASASASQGAELALQTSRAPNEFEPTMDNAAPLLGTGVAVLDMFAYADETSSRPLVPGLSFTAQSAGSFDPKPGFPAFPNETWPWQ